MLDYEFYINDIKKNIYESIQEYYYKEKIYNIIIKNNRPLYFGLILIIISLLLCIVI
jgi:hypothetical protein